MSELLEKEVSDVVKSNVRLVKVVNTIGSNKKVIEILDHVNTWEQLKPILSKNQVPYNKMKAVVGESNVTLEIPNAQLPTTDFTLFLLPVKVKSGGINYTQADLDAVQKTFAAKKSAVDSAKKLGITVERYIELKAIVKGKPVTTTVTTTVAKTVTKIKEVKVEDKTPIINVPKLSHIEKLELLLSDSNKVLSNSNPFVRELNSIITDYKADTKTQLVNEGTNIIANVPKVKIESESEKAARLDREETQSLLKQAEALKKQLGM